MKNHLSLELTALDGSNPLCFFAALGVLRIVDDFARKSSSALPRLSWVEQGYYFPVLYGFDTVGSLVDVIISDVDSRADEPAFNLRLEKDLAIRNLKPTPDLAQSYLNNLAGIKDRRSRAWASSFFSDVNVDRKGKAKPTAFNFCAGNQAFLTIAEEIRTKMTPSCIQEALVGPWQQSAEVKSLSWDSTSTRDYALRATDPSDEKSCIPGLEWLALVGLTFFPVAPTSRWLLTTGTSGRWKNGRFCWPLWSVPLETMTIGSLLRTELTKTSKEERSARGISIVFTSAIGRRDQGGYGYFSPASVHVAEGNNSPLNEEADEDDE